MDDFLNQVQSIVGPLLFELGFELEDVDLSVDEGGRSGGVVYYRSRDSKIQVYESSREASINCMIAPLNAPNEFGPHDRSHRWQYLTEFTPMPNTRLEELVESVSFKPKTTAEQLHWVRDIIGEHFEAAHAGILKANGHR
ncbi:hypothetical protein [Mycobacterium sp. 852014-52144_SCH5372336]|uniref:hypothetical protein n=1 Tax=Mycobacterium sp. 852014-52144_SCH5372336 TaxID=1834115 RepID=UPI0007FBFAF2|nr:hypothetical protein [Mycobacterium sp. 852014-52144_SCH5372336]OBB77135.1 hypothetical protein A5759_04715 [Mycobacterium sp. 852014-52144_SCH5372336]